MATKPTPLHAVAGSGPGKIDLHSVLALVEAHEGYVRGLARALLHDEHQVDDVVQQAWLRAMQSPPRETGTAPVRSWLRTVVQNLVRSDRHAEAARRRRERLAHEASSRQEPAPSVAEIQERESLRRQVVEELLALPKKYRDVLVLRYLEGMTPKAIGECLSLPGATVRSLNARGLNMLRERLDAAHDGNRQRWSLALIPLALPQAAPAAVGTGVAAAFVAWILIMKQHALVTLGVAGLALAILATFAFNDGWLFGAEQPDATTPLAHGTSDSRSPVEDNQPATSERRELDEAAAPTKKPEDWKFSGVLAYLQNADGSPVKQIVFWTVEGGEVPRHEGMLLSKSPPNYAEDGKAGITRQKGACLAKEPLLSGLLWCQPAQGLWVAFKLGFSLQPPTLRLPELGEYRIRMLGIAPEDRWRLLMCPRYIEDQDKDQQSRGGPATLRVVSGDVLLLPKGGERDPVCVVLGVQKRAAQGTELKITTLKNHTYEFNVSGEAFRIENDAATYARAPHQLTFSAKERVPVLECVVLETDGQTVTQVAGEFVVSDDYNIRSREQLVDGRARIGYSLLKAGKRYRVYLLMADGELFEKKVSLEGLAGRKPLTLVRGQGKAALRIVSEERPFQDDDRLVFEAEAGGRFIWSVGTQAYNNPATPLQTSQVSPGRRALHLRIRKAWRRLWILQQSGNLAVVDRLAAKSSYTCRWLPTRGLPTVDLEKIAKQHGFSDSAYFRFEIQLADSEGRSSWQLASWYERAPGKLVFLDHEQEEWATWNKVVPKGMAFRMSVSQFQRGKRRLVWFKPGER